MDGSQGYAPTVDPDLFGAQPFAVDVPMLRAAVKDISQVRAGPRLEAMVEILLRMGPLSGWRTAWAIEALAGRYHERCVKRAIVDLAACGAVSVVSGEARTQGGGLTYRVVDAESWMRSESQDVGDTGPDAVPEFTVDDPMPDYESLSA